MSGVFVLHVCAGCVYEFAAPLGVLIVFVSLFFFVSALGVCVSVLLCVCVPIVCGPCGAVSGEGWLRKTLRAERTYRVWRGVREDSGPSESGWQVLDAGQERVGGCTWGNAEGGLSSATGSLQGARDGAPLEKARRVPWGPGPLSAGHSPARVGPRLGPSRGRWWGYSEHHSQTSGSWSPAGRRATGEQVEEENQALRSLQWGLGRAGEGSHLARTVGITNARHRITGDVAISTLLPSGPVGALTWASQRNRDLGAGE